MSTVQFAVMGTGNSGQCFAADVALKGYPVNLAEVPEFADNLDAIDRKGGIELSGEAGNGFDITVPHHAAMSRSFSALLIDHEFCVLHGHRRDCAGVAVISMLMRHQNQIGLGHLRIVSFS